MSAPSSHVADFDWRCVIGTIETDMANYAAESTFGLPMSMTFLYGCVRDADGTMWNPMRRLTASGGAERLLLQSDLDSDTVHVQRSGRFAASSAGARRRLDGDALLIESDPQATGNPWRIAVTPTTLHWIEEDLFELHGTAVPPGLHWHLPNRSKAMYYLSQIYEIEGTILGRDVSGFIPFDQIYMHGLIYQDDILVQERAEVIWHTWATRYTDGSFEGGHFMVGHRHLGFAIVYDGEGRLVLASTDVDGTVTLGDDRTWPVHMEVRADGQTWEFLPAPSGRMVDLMPMPNPQIEGRWRRVGDDRQPAHWMAWGECAPSHGTSPVRRA